MKIPGPHSEFALRITGGSQLAGDLCVSGSKNAALPEMAAALLTSEPVRLNNVPKVSDTALMAEILAGLGGRAEGRGCGVVATGRPTRPERPCRARPPHARDDPSARCAARTLRSGAAA